VSNITEFTETDTHQFFYRCLKTVPCL